MALFCITQSDSLITTILLIFYIKIFTKKNSICTCRPSTLAIGSRGQQVMLSAGTFKAATVCCTIASQHMQEGLWCCWQICHDGITPVIHHLPSSFRYCWNTFMPFPLLNLEIDTETVIPHCCRCGRQTLWLNMGGLCRYLLTKSLVTSSSSYNIILCGSRFVEFLSLLTKMLVCKEFLHGHSLANSIKSGSCIAPCYRMDK